MLILTSIWPKKKFNPNPRQMKAKPLSEYTTKELTQKLKTVKTLTSIFAGALIALFAINIYQSITNKFTALSIIPIALMPILVINIASISKIKAELKSREQNS